MEPNDILKGRQCILWGERRHIYEFTYMFDFLDYYGYISSDENTHYKISLDELAITDLEELSTPNFLIIICAFDLGKYESILQNYGLIDKMHYIQFEKLFELLDPFKDSVLADRKIAVWGTGETERNFRTACIENGYKINADCYIDNDPQKENTEYCGRPVRQFSGLDHIEQYFIVVASIYYRDIKKELNGQGLQEGKDYLPFSSFMSRPSMMLKRQVYSKEMIDFYCNRPYTWFYYAWFGAYSCCSTWVEYPIGNPAADSPEQCWNSIVAKLYRLSADTRTYCFCKKDACGIINRGKLNEQKIVPKGHPVIHVPAGRADCVRQSIDYTIPEKITLGLDYTCNLHCASCRDHTQVATGEQLRIREVFADEIIKTGWLEKTKELELSGSGEALFSKIDRKILFANEKCKRNSISLMSNGILLNEENLQKLKQHFKSIRLNISIDAAKESTYKELRRGGNWNVLMDNLYRIGKMRRNNDIEYVEIRMVVQKRNYKEMIDFIQLGKKYQVDKVVFTKLLNWDMYSAEDYLEEAMLNKDGSIKRELDQILRTEIFKDEIVVISEFKQFLN